MVYDLEAATKAARNEAAKAPFEFSWGTETFKTIPSEQWPLSVSTKLAELVKTHGNGNGEGDIDPDDLFAVLREMVGGEHWERLLQTGITGDAVLPLLKAIAQHTAGGDLPDLSGRPKPGSTRTSRPRSSKRLVSTS